MLSKNLKSLNVISPFLGQHIAIAVSGGPDSMALLSLLLESYDHSKITVLTVDHQLRPESTTEANFVKDFCNNRNLHHETLTWTSPQKGQKRARDARYDLLKDYCKQNDIKHLFTAHHRNDKQETFLMRIWQGSDLMGLASISAVVEKENDLFVLRPFLNIPKHDILDYIKKKEIPFCIDPSNENEIYLRTLARKTLSSVDDSYFRFMELSGKIRSFLENTALKILEENLTWVSPFLIKINLKVFETKPLIQKLLFQFLARLIGYEGFFPKLKLINLLEKLNKKQSTTAFGVLWSVSRGKLYLSKEHGLKEKIKIIKTDDGFHVLPYDLKISKKIENTTPFEIKILSIQDLQGQKKSPWINFLLSKTHIPLVGIIFSEEIVFIEELLYTDKSMEARGWFFDFPKNNYTKNIPIPFLAL